ncbi:hypothetical protein MFIFM68171_06524 [Madurella fahalii]|uniref:Uncharacterized protein n=1 Tax=Madurella fahalii TaxID=1157608 RepID=A0ABQ0GEX5_9PEZI
MSNTYLNKQQFRAPSGLQPAIPFERPTPRSGTSQRPRVETPIQPPQIPTHTPAARQLHAAAASTRPIYRVRQPPQVQEPSQQPPNPQQDQQPQLDQNLQNAERAYLNTYRPLHTPQVQPVYHTAGEGRPPSPPSHLSYHFQQLARALQVDENGLDATPQGHTPQQTLPPQASPQQHPGRQDQSQPPGRSKDESMEDADDSDSDGGDGGADGNGMPKRPLAPLVQPVTPLQLPTVRPTLLLGPYNTRQEAMNAVMEYAIAQGYMLVQSGCAKAKTPGGGYSKEAPVVRIDLQCDRGGTCKNAGTGKRKRPTHKIGCPTRLKLVCRKRDASMWFIDPRCEQHNHDLNPNNMESLASYRRWRRLQSGGSPVESHKERYERTRKPKVPQPPPPVPAPRFHSAGPQPPPPPATPVHMAALKGQVKILEILLNKGADINVIDSTGRTPLHCAVEGSRMDTVKLLVDRGADVSLTDSKGVSPLQIAVEKGMEDAVLLFIEKGADPNK